jgi:hypothetical protein
MTGLTGAIVVLVLAFCVGCMDDTHQSISPEYLKTARRLQAPLVGYVDAINAMPVKDGHVVQVGGGTSTVEVKGWAVDVAAEKPGRAMAMLVHEKLISCQYGEDRPDVGTALHNENYRFSGYTCQIATSAFNKGDNIVEPILLTGAGTYYSGPKVVVTTAP